MVELYNTSFMNNATNVVDLFLGVGSAINQPYLMGYLITFSFFLVFMILAMRYSWKEIIIVDCFLTTIISILLYSSGMLPAFAISFPAIMLFLGILMFLFM